MDLTTVKTLILFVTLASTVAFGVFPMFFVERFRNARWMGKMTSLSTTFSGGVSHESILVFEACALKSALLKSLSEVVVYFIYLFWEKSNWGEKSRLHMHRLKMPLSTRDDR